VNTTLTETEKHYFIMDNLEKASNLRREGKGWKYIERYLKTQDPRWTNQLFSNLKLVLKTGGLNPEPELDNPEKYETKELIPLGQRDRAAQQLAQRCALTHIDYSEAYRRMENLYNEMDQPLAVSIQDDEDFDFYSLNDCCRWLWCFYRFDYILGDGITEKHKGSGRPDKITLKIEDTAFRRAQEGRTTRDIAQELNISKSTVAEIIKKERELRRQ